MGGGDVELAALIEEATADAYGVDEQLGGFHAKLEEHVAVPFTTTLLGVEVAVVEIDWPVSGGLVAVCRRGRESQSIDLRELPLPTPPPEGVEWIYAYLRWAAGGLT
ncbi:MULTISPECIES: hypothetical protein [Actinomycetes]|uniref:hypothetical protein n=1 Tax=Actinomycetes TaxID=1760 RepID=UPI0027A6EAD4|nr:hypothetical protein PaSha_11700 [Pseudonocardia alni]